VLGGAAAQRHAADAARALGVRVVVADADPSRGDLAVSTEDLDGVVEACRSIGADGLISPGTDWPVRVAAEAAARLGLPHPIDPETARLATEKPLQRVALDRAAVPQPAWSLDGPPGYPCVVKAPDRQGQRAMTIVRTPNELRDAEARALAASRSGRILYEAYLAGPEVTVNGFAAGGRQHAVMTADRVHFPGSPGVAMMHVVPPAHDVAMAEEVAARACAALGIREGPTYVQVVLGREGPAVMEVAARLGGGHDSELARLTTGVDLARLAVLAALGRDVDEAELQPRPGPAGAIRFLQAPPGVLQDANGPDGATFYHPPGHEYGPLRVATDRAGYLVTTAPTREEALKLAQTASKAVTFEVR
jgi:biotin carboxylase